MPKIFKTDSYIAVFYGVNEALLRQEDRVGRVYLEDLIRENADSVKTPHDFLEFLRKQLFEYGHCSNKCPVNGYIGYFQKIGKVTQPMHVYFSVSYESIETRYSRVNDFYCAVGGDNYYVDYFSQHYEQLLSSNTEEIRNNIEEFIRQRDAIQGYNAVGLPVRIEVFYALADKSD